jgi:cytochrome c oxidase cbb3-type subunit 3
MKHTVKICTFLGIAAFFAAGCFVGSRNAEEPRTPGAASPTASTRSNPTFLAEAQVLYEGTTDNLPKSVTAAERERYKRKLEALQADGYQACAGCHLANGGGNKAINATNFTDSGWQNNNSTPGMVTSIVNGKGKIMPSYKNKLTQQQIYYLVEYIRKFEDKTRTDNSVIGKTQPVSTNVR